MSSRSTSALRHPLATRGHLSVPSTPRSLFIPSRSEGPSAAQLSASTPTPVGYPLCFDNDPFCLSPNPFLLITIWIAYVRNFSSSRSPSSLFHSLAKERNASPIVSTVCSLFAQNNRGVPQLFAIPRSPSEGPEWYSRQALP